MAIQFNYQASLSATLGRKQWNEVITESNRGVTAAF